MTRSSSIPPPPEVPPQAALRPAELVGRRVGQVVYYGLIVGFALSATVQITRQVFFAPKEAGPLPWATCEQGIAALYGAVERGRAAAEKGRVDEDDEAPLRRFRAEVGPAWKHRDALGDRCADREAMSSALDSIDRLRYSEEHGVRSRATELTALRRSVSLQLERTLGSAPLRPSASPSTRGPLPFK